jgi:hypothetical protein
VWVTAIINQDWEREGGEELLLFMMMVRMAIMVMETGGQKGALKAAWKRKQKKEPSESMTNINFRKLNRA